MAIILLRCYGGARFNTLLYEVEFASRVTVMVDDFHPTMKLGLKRWFWLLESSHCHIAVSAWS